MNRALVSISAVGLAFLTAASGCSDDGGGGDNSTSGGAVGAGGGPADAVGGGAMTGGTTGVGGAAPTTGGSATTGGVVGSGGSQMVTGGSGAIQPTGGSGSSGTGATGPGPSTGGFGTGATGAGGTTGGVGGGLTGGVTGGNSGETGGGTSDTGGTTGVGGGQGGAGETGGVANPGGAAGSPTGTGGDATGGVVDVVPEPTLIVSGQNDYWQEVEPTEGGGAATITVNEGQEYQEWHGFGGTFNEAGWAALQDLSPEDRARAIELLFSKTDGLALTWGRIPIGASDYALERYTLNDTAGNYDMSAFSLDRDRQYLIPYIKMAQEIRDDVKYWGSPWTVPPWMKDGGENGGYDKGAILSDDQTFTALASYFIHFIEGYEAEGIPIDNVMPQNEPGWSQGYPSCAWGPSTHDGTTTSRPVSLGNFVENYLAPAISDAGLSTDIWFGTLSNNSTFDDYWGSLSNRNLVTGVALQWECVERVGQMVNTGLLVMQSEHKCGNYPWLGTIASTPEAADENSFFPDYAPNNYNYAVESWGLFKQWIEAGVHVYSAWNMVLDKGGFNLDQERPWPQNALLYVDGGQLHVTPYYWAYRHLAQYVEPGAVRVGVSGDALAFKNPDGSIVTVIHGSGSTTLSVGGSTYQFDIPSGGWATFNWQPS